MFGSFLLSNKILMAIFQVLLLPSSFFPSFLSFFSFLVIGSYIAQTVLKPATMQRIALNSWFSCLHFPNAGFTGNTLPTGELVCVYVHTGTRSQPGSCSLGLPLLFDLFWCFLFFLRWWPGTHQVGRAGWLDSSPRQVFLERGLWAGVFLKIYLLIFC